MGKIITTCLLIVACAGCARTTRPPVTAAPAPEAGPSIRVGQSSSPALNLCNGTQSNVPCDQESLRAGPITTELTEFWVLWDANAPADNVAGYVVYVTAPGEAEKFFRVMPGTNPEFQYIDSTPTTGIYSVAVTAYRTIATVPTTPLAAPGVPRLRPGVGSDGVN